MIETLNVSKKYEQKAILKNINLKFPENGFISIMGPSGVGKSTLLNLISGLEKPTTGKVLINNQEIYQLNENKLTDFRLINTAFVFQDFKLIDYLNVYDNVVLNIRLKKKKINKDEVMNVLENLEIQDFCNVQVNKLSGGQKQRVAIARALLSGSKIIYADEPTSSLDIKTRNKAFNFVMDYCKRENILLITVTHEPYIANLSDYVLFIKTNYKTEIIKPTGDPLEIAKKMIQIESEINE